MDRNTKHRTCEIKELVHTAATRGIAITNGIWEQGRTITVGFIGGTTKQRNLVKIISGLWNPYINLYFHFIEGADAEIRVSFEDGGSWSFMGSVALQIPANMPTMNFRVFAQSMRDQMTLILMHRTML